MQKSESSESLSSSEAPHNDLSLKQEVDDSPILNNDSGSSTGSLTQPIFLQEDNDDNPEDPLLVSGNLHSPPHQEEFTRWCKVKRLWSTGLILSSYKKIQLQKNLTSKSATELLSNKSNDLTFHELESAVHTLEGASIFFEALWPPVFVSLLLWDLHTYASQCNGGAWWEIMIGLWSQDGDILSTEFVVDSPQEWPKFFLPIFFLLLTPLIPMLTYWCMNKRNKAKVTIILEELLETLIGVSNEGNTLSSWLTALLPFSSQRHALYRAALLLQHCDTTDSESTPAEMLSVFYKIAKNNTANSFLAHKLLFSIHANKGLVELPDAHPKPKFTEQLLVYPYFHYLKWSHGFKVHVLSDLIFTLNTVIWLYITARYACLPILKIKESITFESSKNDCHKVQKHWVFLKYYGKYKCVSCTYDNMLDQDKFSIQQCFNTLLRDDSYDTILQRLPSLLKIKKEKLKHLDFSYQNWRAWPESAFKQFLDLLTPREDLVSFDFSSSIQQGIFINDGRFQSLNEFLQNRHIDWLTFERQSLGDTNLGLIFQNTLIVNALVLSGNNVSPAFTTTLSQHLTDAIRSIIINNNPISDAGAITIITNFPKLEQLHIANTRLAYAGLDGIMTNQQNLQDLKIDSNLCLPTQNITNFCNALLESGIESLSTRNLSLYDQQISQLALCVNQSAIKSWDISDNPFQTDGFLNTLFNTIGSNLATLIADNIAIGSLALENAAQLLHQLTLQGLSLSGVNQPAATSWLKFMQEIKNSMLQYLWVDNNGWGDELTQNVFNETKTLSLLSIANNELTDNVSLAIRQGLYESSLKTLIMSRNHFTSLTLENAGPGIENSQLKTLIIEYANLGKGTGFKKFKDNFINSPLELVSFKANGLVDQQITPLIQGTVNVPGVDKLGKGEDRFQARCVVAHGKPASMLQWLNLADNNLTAATCQVFDATVSASGIQFFQSRDCQSISTPPNLQNQSVSHVMKSAVVSGIGLFAMPTNSPAAAENNDHLLVLMLTSGLLAASIVAILLYALLSCTTDSATEKYDNKGRHYHA